MTVIIAVLTSDESGASSLADINSNFESIRGEIADLLVPSIQELADDRVPQEATEAVDGTRTTFTFATLTEEPAFIHVDGLNKRAQGTRTGDPPNWTWDNGALQATLAAPPQNDVFALKA